MWPAIADSPDAGEPLVTVVIPTRDRWPLLRSSLATVLRQEEVTIEAVVVDDGSLEPAPDGGWPWEDARVRCVRNSTASGVASARNTGIAAARGRWVAFLDDDDLWAPRKLARQLEAAEESAASFAYCAAALFDERSGRVDIAGAPPPESLARLLASFNAIPAGASNVLVRTELVRTVGGFDPRFFHLADWDLWIRLAHEGRAAICDEPLVGYRIHPASMRSVAGGVLEELRQLDRKHPANVPSGPERIWVYRWLADSQLLAGRRGAAVVTVVRGALRARGPSGLRRLGGGLLGLRRSRVQSPEKGAMPVGVEWLRLYLAGNWLEPAPPAADWATARRGLRAVVADGCRQLAARAALGVLRLTRLRAGIALVYHGVGDPGRRSPENELSPVTATATFREQAHYLGGHWRTVTASQLIPAVETRKRGERFPVAVTFDDDLRSHVDVAAPILVNAGLRATFFLTGATLETASSFWWEGFQRALDEGVDYWDLLPPELRGLPPRAVAVALEAEPAEVRDAFTRTILDRLGGELEASGLRTEQVKTLARAGFEIGFHTRAHERLTDVEDAELTAALSGGRQELEEVVGATVQAVAYPHGAADERVAEAAAGAGYAFGFTTTGRVALTGDNPYLVGRLYPSRSSLGHFAMQLTTAIRRGGQEIVGSGGA